MAVNVVSTLTLLDAADVTTNYSSHNISGVMGSLGAVNLVDDDEAPPINGVDCLGWDCDIETGGYYYSFTATDYSGTHFWIWGLITNAFVLEDLVPSSGQSGIFIIGKEGSNYGYWHVGGADTYEGGWRCFVADLAQAPDTNNGTAPDMSNCDGLGLGFRCTGKSKATHNCYIDFLRVGNAGLQMDTDTSSVADWEDIFDGDNSIGVGCMRRSGLANFVQGELQIGDTTSGDMEFSDTGKIVVFEDVPVAASLHEILVQGNSGGTINFQMGTKSGTRGISGCFLKGNIPFAFTATDTDIDELKLYGCVFNNAGAIALPASGSGREVLDCSFEACGEVDADTCSVKYCNFIDSDGVALVLDSTSHNCSDCNFINCVTGIEFQTEGTYALSNMVFSGCTTDIDSSVEATSVASYSESNQDSDVNLYTGYMIKRSMQFTATAGELSRARFYLKKSGSPTGNVYCELYADGGVLPTGSALATSQNVATSDIGTSYAVVDFEFWDEYTMSAATEYWIAVCYDGGDSSNYIIVGADGSSPSGDLAAAMASSTWAADIVYAYCHYVNRDGIVKINASGTSNPGTTSFSSTVDGAIIIVNTKTLSVHVQDEDTNDITGASVRIENQSTGAQISQGTTDGNGDYTDTGYNYVADVDVYVVVRKSSAGTRYFPVRQAGQIDSDGLSVIITMVEDTIA